MLFTYLDCTRAADSCQTLVLLWKSFFAVGGLALRIHSETRSVASPLEF
jgi:hypothetical protein